MSFKNFFAALCGLAALASQASAVTIYTEDFDGSGSLGYTTEDTSGNAVAQFSDGFGDYFIETDGSDIGTFVEFTNPSGRYFAAQDTDGDGNPSVLRLRIDGIDVSNYTNLALSIDFAEDDDGSNQDWDDADFVHANLSLDTVAAGADNDPSLFGLWFESSVNSGFNGEPTEDLDFDGDSDVGGAVLTDTFATFTKSFSQTGNTAGILITFALDSGDEDVAIDNITLTGDLVPEPTSLALFLLGMTGLAASRKRG